MLRLITSADSRLAAISNVVRVRVEFSKNRLNTALPRSSGTFFTSRSAIDDERLGRVEDLRDRPPRGRPSSVSRCAARRCALSCGLRMHAQSPAAALRRRAPGVPSAAARQHDGEVARDRDARADVRRLDRQLAAAAVDQHRELDRRGPAEVEQLVDRRAHAAAGVEHVVDQHDRRAVRRRTAISLRLRAGLEARASRSRRDRTRRR